MSLSPTKIPFNSLVLRDLSLQVSLGCEANERAERQEVRLTVEFRFQNSPKGAITDVLKDTICYAELSDALKNKLENQEYKLIERLAYDAYEIATRLARETAQVSIEVHKVNPPVENLKGGAWFRCGDFQL